jgi:hypothetical protein
MVTPDKKRPNRVLERSIPLIHECLEERISITMLLSTLGLMERGLIKEVEDLDSFMKRRAELNPDRTRDAERIKELITKLYF